jgi:flagella basal body P-ring formation protein FlgA
VTLNWLKNISLIFILNTLVSSPIFASERLKGLHIKEQAVQYFSEQGLNLSLLVSDKRTFFPCSGPLDFHQRHENDWSTVLVRCSSENWETFIRSANLSAEIVSSESIPTDNRLSVAVLIKNISKGQVISEEYLGFETRPERQIHGAYNHISGVLGRKAKSNIAAGTILKARHLDTVYSVDKNDSVLVIAANKAIIITTSAIALENGQVGDMISVKNIKSEKIFKVMITGKKKVAPITNM